MENQGEGKWPRRLAPLCKTKKIEKLEPVSQFSEAAEQFQLVKKRKKVSWNRLHCQDELHISTTQNKFATLTPREDEPELDEDKTGIGGSRFFALDTAVQETCAKRKVDTKKNIDMLVKVRESPVGGCAKNSSDAQPSWRRVSTANRQNTFLTMKFMNHSNPGAVKTFNPPPESQSLLWETCGCHCA